MTHSNTLLLALGLFTASCAAVERVPPPGESWQTPRASPGLVETTAAAPTAHDISEKERRDWFDSHQPPPAPERVVERVVVREPTRYVYEPRRAYHDDWYVPFSLSLGYWGGWGGHHHGRGGWGWGFALHDRWWW